MYPCATKYPPFCRHPVRENPLKQLFSIQAGKEKRGYPSPRSGKGKWAFNVDRKAHHRKKCKLIFST
jgi:hypothetical protein